MPTDDWHSLAKIAYLAQGNRPECNLHAATDLDFLAPAVWRKHAPWEHEVATGRVSQVTDAAKARAWNPVSFRSGRTLKPLATQPVCLQHMSNLTYCRHQSKSSCLALVFLAWNVLYSDGVRLGEFSSAGRVRNCPAFVWGWHDVAGSHAARIYRDQATGLQARKTWQQVICLSLSYCQDMELLPRCPRPTLVQGHQNKKYRLWNMHRMLSMFHMMMTLSWCVRSCVQTSLQTMFRACNSGDRSAESASWN